MKKFLSLIVLSLLMMTGLAWAQTYLINENIQSWTGTGTTYSHPTQTIAVGTVKMTQCIVQPTAAAVDVCSEGRIQMGVSTGTVELPQLNSIGLVSFNMVAGGDDRTVKLQKYISSTETWEDLKKFTGISTIGVTYSFIVNSNSPMTIRLSAPSAAVYVHDIIVTPYSTDTQSPILNVSPTNLSGFCYTKGKSSAIIKRFIISGVYLTDDINIAVTGNFNISKSPSSSYTTSLSLTQQDGEVGNTTIHVRMLAGLDVGAYEGTITVSSSGLTKTVALQGGVYSSQPADCYFVDFEGGSDSKPNYDSATVKLSEINWNMTNVLIGGTEAGDFKIDTQSARLRGYGTSVMTMIEDKPNGLGTLSFFYRRYGNDPQTAWKVEYSRDQGGTWTAIGNNFTAPTTDVVQEFSGIVNIPGNVRVRIREASGSGATDKRLNIDNILMTRFFDYFTDVAKVISGLGTVTLTEGYANNSDTTMPPIPNTSIGSDEYKSLSLDLVASDTWTVQIDTEFDFCAYNWQAQWYDVEKSSGMFTINIPEAAKSTNDLFIVLSDKIPSLPVELSSFMVTLNTHGEPTITWETQTETGVNGFYIYRSMSRDLNDAIMISSLIPATNSSLAHSYSFVDTELSEDGTYYYWLNVKDLNGHESYYGPAELNYLYIEAETAPEVIYQTGFRSIYPNPFNPNTNIGFELAEAGEVNLSVYNARGQLVRSFAPFTHDKGQGSIVWDGKDDAGNSVSSGIYFFRMKVGAKSHNTKALMLK